MAPLSLSLPVNPSSLFTARQALSAWLERAGVAGEDMDDVLIAANEACMNAVEHSGSPPGSEIEFSGSLRCARLTLRVVDVGSWRVGEPREDRGHGLGLMEKLMDSVDVDRGASDSGTTVVLEKDVSFGEPGAPRDVGLRVEATEVRGTPVAVVQGEIDLAGVPRVERGIAEAAPGHGRLVLDLAGVSYLDSSGVHMLFRLAQGRREGGASFGVVAPEGAVRRVLELTGADSVIPLEHTVDAAIDRLEAAEA